MHLIRFLLFCLLVVSVFNVGCGYQQPERVIASSNFDPVDTAPGDLLMQKAQAMIAKSPDAPAGYTHLAILFVKRARETGDFSLNSKAEAATGRALKIAPNDITARKLQASLSLTFHRFPEALDLGTKLKQEFPNDSFVYGVLTDANVELGNYDAAVQAAQAMVDLKPNTASYARVAHIRSLYGDHNGAVEMYKTAARTSDPADKESQSWCLVQLGDELWKNGKYADAEKVYDEALTVLPNYYLAEIGKGRVRASQNDLESAIQILTKTSERVPNVDSLILLGDIYTEQGNFEKAKQQYDLVEIVESKIGVNNDQKRLALMWADNDIKLDEALVITIREHEMRKDVNTADALAWAHYKKGNLAEAKVAITEALRLKSNEARFLYHAGMIEKALGNRLAALQSLEKAIKLNPAFDLIQTEVAKKAIADLKSRKRS